MSHERLFSFKEFTGLDVYRFAEDFLQREIARRTNKQAPVSVMLKKVVDTLALDQMGHISYADLRMLFSMWERSNQKNRASLVGMIVFTEQSFPNNTPLNMRAYLISSSNNAFMPGAHDSTIFGICVGDESTAIRLDLKIDATNDDDKWIVDYCIFLGRDEE